MEHALGALNEHGQCTGWIQGPAWRRCTTRLDVVIVPVGQGRPWRCVMVVVGSILAVSACGTPSPFKIENDTSESVALAGCAQEPQLRRTIPPHAGFAFSDNLGERVLGDDPGFACLIRAGDGRLMCLQLPTDQSSRTVFRVSQARPIDSLPTCVRHSDPHP